MTTTTEQGTAPWTEAELEKRLRAQKGRYHDLHPFHVRMNAGELTREELSRWAANRFYYQSSIPMKDAAILSNCPDRAIRREWIQRIVDHDGGDGDDGGIDRWLRLGEAFGVSREDLLSGRHLLPAVRFSVDAYVNFCRRQPWIIAVASSLTELFGPIAIAERIPALEKHYPWLDSDGLAYFRKRLGQAPRDADYALGLVLRHCRTLELQERAVAALQFKCDLLWAQLDAIERGDTRPVLD